MTPDDRNKVALLAALVIVVLGCGAFLWMPLLRGSGAATPAAGGAAPAVNATPNANATLASVSAAEEYDRDTPPGPAGRDPFTPPAEARAVNRTNAPATTAGQRASAASHPRTDMVGMLPPGGELTLRPAPISPPPAPTIELKGVIPGDPAIAVVNIGGQIHYKQEGESLGGAVRVMRITEAGVVLQRGGRNVVLDVGHTLPAESAPAPQVTPTTNPKPAPAVPGPKPKTPPVATNPSSSATPDSPAKPPTRIAAAPEVRLTAVRPQAAARPHPRRHRAPRVSSSDPLEGHFVGRRL